ncbi:a disintegrin and metalloproteinase with thrombospondin motifs adt-1 [Caerostris extrusa]|uniref:A disintegrin and metalloproteinase with thrombospondin motifs adt-1 n=1 Tax=Caerostris extrusa TaxID=172846 RepID=A0AAV4NTX0_CAEEX|nr:a disintegrin and metalloproteinase with thrombospondin motifs adt-1 [Caerostris extrusa]
MNFNKAAPLRAHTKKCLVYLKGRLVYWLHHFSPVLRPFVTSRNHLMDEVRSITRVESDFHSCRYISERHPFEKNNHISEHSSMKNIEHIISLLIINLIVASCFLTPAEQSPVLFITTESVFGQTVQMQLRKNDRLLAPSFRAIRIEGDDALEKEMDSSYYPICHYIGSNGSIAAALSSCGATSSKGLSGLLMLPDGSVQIQPVDQDLAEILGINLLPDKRSAAQEENILHLVLKPPNEKRLSVPEDNWEDERYVPSPRSEYELDDDDIVRYLDFDDLNTISDSEGPVKEEKGQKEEVSKRQESYAKDKQLYLELAVFFDQKGYEMFQPHVKSEEQLVDLILGFVNQVESEYLCYFLDASFISTTVSEEKIQFSIVRLEVMKKQPSDLPHADGDRDKLLDSFCAYQAKRNPDSDKDPNHWDLALYISGQKNGITMEFGTTSDDGRPYPSAGLLSTYIAAHEIGHNLGMYHDGPPNNECPSNGHVMSPSRGTKGETTWSKCSSKVLEKMDKKCLFDEPQGTPTKDKDHSKFNEKPGQVWNAHDQCKIFLRDQDATVFNETVFSVSRYLIFL